MTDVLRYLGVLVAFLGAAGLFTSVVGPQYPLLATTSPAMDGVWRNARRWGFVGLTVGVVLLLLSLL